MLHQSLGPQVFFVSLSLSLFYFLIVDSVPPGSSPLKDPNTWVQSLGGELEGQRCLVVRRKKACEGDGKAAGLEEATKGGGEGLTAPVLRALSQ